MKLPIAPAIAALVGAVAAFGIAALPVPVLESLVVDSGLPAIMSAAEPPLGLTARALLALGIGGFAAVFAWISAFILFGAARLTLGKPGAKAAASADPQAVRAPVLRRADAHPDAPPRPPLLATRDLGAPFAEEVEPIEGLPLRPSAAAVTESEAAPIPLRGAEPLLADPIPVAPEPVPEPAPQPIPRAAIVPPPTLAERALPADLDQPLAAFDPQAIPAVPMPSPLPFVRRRPAPAAIFEPHERFETFELPTPAPIPMTKHDPLPETAAPAPAPEPVEPIARPETEASVHALLERLERGVVRRNQAQAERAARSRKSGDHRLEDALVTLRNLARQA